MKKYTAYKDSGIEWIREIPTEWSLIKPKFYLYKVARKPLPDDEVITCFRDGVVTLRRNRRTLGFTNALKEIGYQRIHKGDLVLHEMDAFAGSIGVSDSFGKSTPVYTVIEKRDEYDVRYWMYLLREMSKTGFIESLSKGIRERTTDFRWQTWKNLYLPVPTTQEQQHISDYLDHKTQQIDSLIEKTQRKIELLKEQRTAFINQVVTKGLDPNAKMKDTGVEWIGEIPSGWNLIPLKHVCEYNKESLGNDTDPDYELDYIEINNVDSSGTIEEPTHYPFSEAPSRCRRVVKKNDIIISTVRTYLKAIGFIEDSVSDLICSTGFCVVTPDTAIVMPKVLFYLFRTEWFISTVIALSDGVSYPSIQSEKLVGIKIVLPPIGEQQELVDFLDHETQQLDSRIAKETKRIELLKEYRNALISEVVTGKVDVREETVA